MNVNHRPRCVHCSAVCGIYQVWINYFYSIIAAWRSILRPPPILIIMWGTFYLETRGTRVSIEITLITAISNGEIITVYNWEEMQKYSKVNKSEIFKSQQILHARSQGSHHTITIGPKFKAVALIVEILWACLYFLVIAAISHHRNHHEMKYWPTNRYDQS